MLFFTGWMVIGAVTFDCCTLNAFWCVISLFISSITKTILFFFYSVCLLPKIFSFFSPSSFSSILLHPLFVWFLLADELCYVMTEPVGKMVFHYIAQAGRFCFLSSTQPIFQLVFKQAYLFGFQIERHRMSFDQSQTFYEHIYLFVELNSVFSSV